MCQLHKAMADLLTSERQGWIAAFRQQYERETQPRHAAVFAALISIAEEVDAAEQRVIDEIEAGIENPENRA